MRILYYVTAHGYGHGVRTVAIANKLSPSTTVAFRTNLPPTFFNEEMRRPYELFPSAFDCGCIQRDSMSIDIGATLDTYASIALRNAQQLDREVAWCREQEFDGIVSDIVPFAFDVAHRLTIPGIACSNFTWYDIYAPYTTDFPQFAPIVEEIRRQYSHASLLLQLEPSDGMGYFPYRTSVPVVGRKGRGIREKLIDMLDLPSNCFLGLIYPGTFGMGQVQWKRLERFDNWHFLGLFPLPESPQNFHQIDKSRFFYEDLTASCDIVISKLGYSTVAECMLNGTPLMYLPRRDFSEYPTLERAVREWGGGIPVSEDDYNHLQWEKALCSAREAGRMPPISDTGAQVSARAIERCIAQGT